MIHIEELMALLEQSGCKPYYVGGCVRDHLLGLEPADYDITVSALPDRICTVLREAGLCPGTDGIKYGTVTVGSAQGLIEITTHRKDGSYSDSRRPDTVEFTQLLSEDLERRDFTVNAMAQSSDGQIIDPFGGQKDLENRTLRCVGDPKVRFSEDALRMLRAARFAAKLGFEPDPLLLDGMRSCADKAAALSDTRVGVELVGMWLSPEPEKGFELLLETGVWKKLFPGFTPSVDVAKVKTMPLSLTSRLSYLLWGQTTSVFYAFLRRMSVPKNLFDDILLVSTAESIELRPDPPFVRRQIRTYGDLILSVLDVRQARGEDVLSFRQIAEKELADHVCVTLSGLDISGDDLIDAGIPAGRGIGVTLSYLLDRVMDDPELNTHETLLSLALDFAKKEGYCF